jgi:hypothetical protein
MEEQFKNSLRASLTRQFEKLYTPKLPDAHVSRIVMYESMNCSASSGYHVKKLVVNRSREIGDIVRVQVNETVLLYFNIQDKKEVPNA